MAPNSSKPRYPEAESTYYLGLPLRIHTMIWLLCRMSFVSHTSSQIDLVDGPITIALDWDITANSLGVSEVSHLSKMWNNVIHGSTTASNPFYPWQVFPCCKWLARDEGDGLISRQLYETVSLRREVTQSESGVQFRRFSWNYKSRIFHSCLRHEGGWGVLPALNVRTCWMSRWEKYFMASILWHTQSYLFIFIWIESSWNCTIWTSNKRNAGTDAKVYLQVKYCPCD